MSSTQISTSNGLIPAYLAAPVPALSGLGPWPGVVVVHDGFGLHDDIRGVVDRFATAGYLALAPNLYSRGRGLRCIKSVMRDLYCGHGQAFDDIDAARVTLTERTDCSRKIGVAGFCMGGAAGYHKTVVGFADLSMNDCVCTSGANSGVHCSIQAPWQGVQPGYYRVMSRARDNAGNVQPRPEDVVWNQHGLGYNGHFPLDLIVDPASDMP